MMPKRLLYVSHRWLGVAMCLFLAMWCVSGVVMMYVGFPELTQDEYYAGLEPLAADRIAVGPEEPLTMVDSGVNVEQLLLTSSGERPVYLLKAAGAAWQGMHADTGARIRQMPADAVVASAVHFYKAQHPEYEAQHPEQTAVGEYLEQLHMDQWSVSDGLHPYRPLHRVAIDDGLGTELYLSSLTGQVVRDTRRSERIWNWLGANLHWIYPVQLRKHRSTWENVIIVLALAGLVSVITGAIIGFTRLRLKRRYPDGSRSPYRGMTKYHHVIGLAGLVFLLTFLFSGLMSVGPWGIFDSNSSFAEQRQRYQQPDGPRHNSARPLPVLRVKFDDPEATWFHIDPSTGQILSRLTERRRVQRWVYQGLHTYDFNLLISNRPAWDVWMIFLCGFVFVFSVTSVVIAVRYLMRHLIRKHSHQ